MSDKVIAETGAVAILDDGTTRHPSGRDGWISAAMACDLLADAVRRLSERIEAVDRRLTAINEDAIARRVAQWERIEAVENSDAETGGDLAELANRVEDLGDRVGALGCKVRDFYCEQTRSCACLACLAHDTGYQKGSGEGYEAGRAEMAREIAAGVRRFNHSVLRDGPIIDGERWANWIAREYLNTEGE